MERAMNNLAKTLVLVSCGLSLLITACGGGGGNSGGGGGGTQTTTYTLTVASTAPASGVAITASPKDNSSTASGTTSFALTYNAGTSVTLTAPATSGGYTFVKWTGCTSAATVTCTVTLNTNTTVTANYNAPSIKSVTVSPSPETATIGTQVSFTATVTGANNFSTAVTWSVLGPPGSSLSSGNITSTGLYTTPYPAPATVTVTATSVEDTTQSGSVVVTLAPPATVAGPALTVNTTNQTHAISPYIYGWNDYQLNPTAAQAAGITVNRFGGDGSQRYNYLLDFSNSASDWWFENQVGNTGVEATGEFNAIVESNNAIGVKTLGTVDVLGWVSTNGTACSFPKSTYPNQTAFSPDRNGDCGNGVYPQGYPAGANACTNASGCNITGNDPTLTSMAVGPSFAGDWVTYLVGKFGDAASGGVAIYDLDNEPAWWDAVHRDVHPAASTYDEVTNNGMAVAEAVKTADPTAEVSGPVVDNWWNYFYSKKDMESGWGQGPCYVPWANPVDREAHGGVPFIEYYLQQFAAYDATNSVRLLDYLDLHTYYAADNLGFGLAGDTDSQIARLNSTRVFWDPTYTDPNEQQPNYPTDSNYGGATNCNPPLQAPQLIPMAKNWVAKDYPGTKIAFTEYNWGGQEHINGALAQADILGIFGAYGLDMATLWGPPDPTTQVPGLMAYEIFRNYDGKGSMFGDTALSSSSSSQGKLSVYGAVRSSDNAITIVVINKTYGDLTSTLSLGNFTPNGNAKVFLYSAANLAAIAAQPDITVTAPTGASTTSTIGATFPASSITLFVIPQ
jgi:hypothetical protein